MLNKEAEIEKEENDDFEARYQEEKKSFSRACMIIVCIVLVVSLAFSVTINGVSFSGEGLKAGVEELSGKAKQSAKEATKEEIENAAGNYGDLTTVDGAAE